MATAPLLVLLLPEPLERFGARALAEELLRLPRVVAVDPPRITYRTLDRLPESIGAWLAYSQAGRLSLPGEVRAVCMFDPLQYALARGMLARHEACELWYGRLDEPRPGRAGDLDALARERATFVFDREGVDAIWQRLRELGVA